MDLLSKMRTAVEPNSSWRNAISNEIEMRSTATTEVVRTSPPEAPAAVRELMEEREAGWTTISGMQHQWSQPPQRGAGDVLAAYVLSPMVRACVQRVVQAFSRVQFYVRENGGDENYDHDSIALMHGYNRRLIGSQGRRLEQTYLDVCGECITLIHPGAKPGEIELWPVPPTWVTISTRKGERIYQVQINGHQYEYEEHEVLHRWEVDLLNPYGRGKGGAVSVADEIETDEYASRHTKGYFFNSTVPEFIAVIRGAKEAEAKRLKEHYVQKHQGWDKTWQPMFTHLDLDIKELTRKLGDERVEEIRKFAMDVVRWMYGVPPEIIGMVENSNRATIREAREIMGEFVTDPRCQSYQELWQHQIIGPKQKGVKVGYDSPIPKIFGRRDEIMAKNPYHFTRNEFRREAGLKDVADGDIYVVPVNIDVRPAQRSLADCGSKTPLYLVGSE